MNNKIEMMSVDELIPYENNPRLNDYAVDYVAESIQNYGFKVPIIIDKNNVIVAGHTRLKAAQQLGIKEVPCIIADDLTDEQIKAFRIADNKVSDFSLWDNTLLLQELEEISDDLFTGFNESDLFDKANFDDVDILDETDNDILDDNEEGVIYEITFKSQDKSKIDKVKKWWEENFGEG